ncbi:acetate--CoA ligase family protein [Croceicoccus sediminis]|uniref:acetate--CoA ligase family protein n=1 Tax=Croceicoccus sediminis TaxID=2571150 RepID=UPI001183EA10|nr:acetate--CoA ligase family protein [Croceicoccus sediminis]
MTEDATGSLDRVGADISRLLKPRSVAIVGASPTPGALGNSVMRNLDRLGFAGDLHLVNPRRAEIDGRPCVSAIDDLPEGIDVAVLAIPGPAVLDSVRALARRKAGAAIIFSAGFAEGGEEGIEAQAEIGRISRETGMVIEGPNCLGLVNFLDGIALTFVEIPPVPRRPGRNVALVSQSGAMAIVEATTLISKDLGLSYSISTGNEAASGVEDYLEQMLDDDDTQIVGMIVEQFRDPARFLTLAAKAREIGKPIVLLHPGKSAAARESAATHTGAMAGDWTLMRTKVRDAGVVLVDNLEELGDVLDLAARVPAPPTGAAAVLTESGAFKALTLDLCEGIGLDLPAPSDDASTALRAAMPDFIPVSNPMDLTAQALVDPDLYRRALEALLRDPQYGSVVFAIIQTDVPTSKRKFPAVVSAIEELRPDRPVIFAGMDDGAEVPAEWIARLRELGVPYFSSPDRAFRAIRRYGEAMAPAPQRSTMEPVALDALASGTIPEYRAKDLLAPAGIPFPEGGFASTLEEANAVCAKIGFPVALKAQSAALSHKSDAGGVILNVMDNAGLAEAWDRLYANVAAYAPALVLDGVLIEKMGQRGVEMIVGAKTDPDWGPVILIGFGGVQAELHKDVRLITPDLSAEAIEAELLALKGAPLLTGFRGSPRLDIGALARLVERLGAVVRGTPEIAEIDLNPVVVFPEGQGCVALDALIQAG